MKKLSEPFQENVSPKDLSTGEPALKQSAIEVNIIEAWQESQKPKSADVSSGYARSWPELEHVPIALQLLQTNGA